MALAAKPEALKEATAMATPLGRVEDQQRRPGADAEPASTAPEPVDVEPASMDGELQLVEETGMSDAFGTTGLRLVSPDKQPLRNVLALHCDGGCGSVAAGGVRSNMVTCAEDGEQKLLGHEKIASPKLISPPPIPPPPPPHPPSSSVLPPSNPSKSDLPHSSFSDEPSREATGPPSPGPTLPPSPPLSPSWRPLQRKRRMHRDTDPMEHSGLEGVGWEAKRSRVPMKDDVLLCLRISEDIGSESTPCEVAKELSRCLHEPKYELLKDVVRVVGAEKALDTFTRTSEVQENGGVVIADDSNNKKKTPGGVFLTMVKNSVTEDDRKEIFRRDKEIRAVKHKNLKRRQRMQQQQKIRTSVKEKASRQLQIFRAQLNDASVFLPVVPGFRKDRNMHKRHYGPAARSEDKLEQKPRETTDGGRSVFDRLGSKGLGESSVSDRVEAMEVDPSPGGARRSQRGSARGRELVKPDSQVVIETEERLAEEFEQLEDCDLVDCVFDL